MKTLADYTLVVMPDDGRWLAYVPAIPSCYAVGDSPTEAQSELAGVFEMILEEAGETGIALPEDIKELIPVAVG